jgi:hypothetical protein
MSRAFIATETGRLARLGLVSKNPNPRIAAAFAPLTPKGEAGLAARSRDRAVNDDFFKPLDRTAFQALAPAAALVEARARSSAGCD